MRYRSCTARSISWLRIGAAATATALALGFTSLASAGTTTGNKKCRAGVGSQLSTVAKKGMVSQEKCYTLAAKANVPSEICTAPDSFPFAIIDGAVYAKSQTTAETNLITKSSPLCKSPDSDETRDNYANGDTAETYPSIDSLLAGSANYIVGTADLAGDPVKVLCQKTIAVARRNIATKMLSEAVKCQKTQDAAATLSGFGPLSMSPNCLAETTSVTNTITAETNKIVAKCGTAPHLISGYPSGAAVGACSPLPTCATDAARATGRNLALAEYPGQTCKGTVTPTGRTITVALAAPAGVTLGGADVRVDYPRFQAGIPGNGTEAEVESAVLPARGGDFVNAIDHDGAVDVSLAFGAPSFAGGTAFTVSMDKCEDFSKGLCSVTTATTCGQSKDCSSHCLEVAEGGTTGGTNTSCQFDSDCPATGPLPGLLQKCVCPTCQTKHCVGPNTNVTTNATCSYNEDCSGRCSNNPWNLSGGSCNFDAQCGAGNTCVFKKACAQYPKSLCLANADCDGTNAPVCTAGKCSAGPVIGNTCAVNTDCQIGTCTAASAHPGRTCTFANQAVDCPGGTCDTLSAPAPVFGLCNVGDPVNGGGFCLASENCIAQDEHCSVSQYLGCGKPTDPACPAGEDCTTQGALTKCTVTNALDEFANEVDGVSCTIGVSEP